MVKAGFGEDVRMNESHKRFCLCRVYSSVAHDPLDRQASEFHAEVHQRSSDFRVAARAMHQDSQLLDGSRPTAPRSTCVLLGDELAIAAQDGVRVHESGELTYSSAGKLLARGQSTPLSVRKRRSL